ncbi:maleylpyruvate isomerase family mycothiol-dependent enzyme [Geodermatophilus africanus]|uniref:maleylpyruvate isomerase family mycothiol-dependent enzyme n=1 Tax=Geodermatophilus africanus TaxID=1137993 RepID=UPI001480A97B|nr:maleylpyruvate isomerase family mycothiol-dependent enzyme [Geodermatophilus africanus]
MTDSWQAVAAERAALVADLGDLGEADWRAPSLCDGLDVEEVVAHLTAGASSGPLRWLAGLARCRFDVDRMVDVRLREQLDRTPEETLRRFRGVVDSRTAPTRGNVDAWLGEAVVHGEDVRRPLGICHAYAPAALERVARFYAARDFTVPSKRRAAGLRLEASDGPFASGKGPLVRGRTVDLVLAMAGRPVALDNLEGPGLPTFAARVVAPSGRAPYSAV